MATTALPESERNRTAARSLGLKLFLWLFGAVIAAFAVYAFVATRAAVEGYRETVESGALRLSELIQKSTRYEMLLNRKEEVHRIIEDVAEAQGVQGVRVYDKAGTIIFSADPAEMGRQVDLEAEACIVCHGRGEPLRSLPQEERVRIYREPGGQRILGLINPIENEPSCADAACHAHPPEQTVLGVLDVKMSLTEADARIAATRRLTLVAAVLSALLAGVISAVFIDRVVRRPVHSLIAGTEQVARGELDTRIEAEGGDEIGRLARAFNRMTRDLRRAREENAEWAATLERKVVEKTEELSRTQKQVVHMEKMASLGKLAATVAHELNNPLAGILNYAKLVQRSLVEGPETPDSREEVVRFLTVIEKESSRCGDIVRNLLLFARRSGVELEFLAINKLVERALMLMRHHLEMAGVQLEVHPAPDDLQVVCDGGQIEQALVALAVNAVEAMGPGGTLTVTAEAAADGGAVLTVADTGSGIPPEALPRIFEPFFTTKTGGSGVGLGLAVVYGIAARHGGSVEVDSEVDRGTTFRIRLPRRPPAGTAAATAAAEEAS